MKPFPDAGLTIMMNVKYRFTPTFFGIILGCGLYTDRYVTAEICISCYKWCIMGARKMKC